jgi:hypothetical protein
MLPADARVPNGVLFPAIESHHPVLRQPMPNIISAIVKFDKCDLLNRGDLSYVYKDHARTLISFECIGARYERPYVLITANRTVAERHGRPVGDRIIFSAASLSHLLSTKSRSLTSPISGPPKSGSTLPPSPISFHDASLAGL